MKQIGDLKVMRLRFPKYILALFCLFLIISNSGFFWPNRNIDIKKSSLILESQQEKKVKKELGRLIFSDFSEIEPEGKTILHKSLSAQLTNNDVFIRVAVAEILWREFDDNQGGIEIVNALIGDDREAELFALFTIFRLGERSVELLVDEYKKNGEVGRTQLALSSFKMKQVTDGILKYLEYPITEDDAQNFETIWNQIRKYPTKTAANDIKNIIDRILLKKTRTTGEEYIWKTERYYLNDKTKLRSKSLKRTIEKLDSWSKKKKIVNIMRIAETVGTQELFPQPENDELRASMKKEAQEALENLREKSNDEEVLDKIDFAFDIVKNNKIFSGLTFDSYDIGWDQGSIRPLYGKSLQRWIMRDRY